MKSNLLLKRINANLNIYLHKSPTFDQGITRVLDIF